MQPRGMILNQLLHPVRDIRHITDQVIIVQHKNGVFLEISRELIDERCQDAGKGMDSPCFQALQQMRRTRQENGQEMRQEQGGIAVWLSDGVPEDFWENPAQLQQGGGFSEASAGVNQGEWIEEGRPVLLLQFYALKQVPAGLGRDQFAFYDHFVKWHVFILAQSGARIAGECAWFRYAGRVAVFFGIECRIDYSQGY